mgnify:CR=1 FL=1
MSLVTLAFGRLTVADEELTVEVDYNDRNGLVVGGFCRARRLPGDRTWAFVYRAKQGTVELRGRGVGQGSFTVPAGERIVFDVDGDPHFSRGEYGVSLG